MCGEMTCVFPFLFGRAFIEATEFWEGMLKATAFPFLFGRAFIEARNRHAGHNDYGDFPSFSEGLSLRLCMMPTYSSSFSIFPFLFGRAFIEAGVAFCFVVVAGGFPFLFGRAFIEASLRTVLSFRMMHFPSFSEGLSLRPVMALSGTLCRM